MKNLILLSIVTLFVSCSSQRALSIKSIKLQDGPTTHIGKKEYKECAWAVVLGTLSPYDKFKVEKILSDNDPKIAVANDVKITHSGMGMSGIGRFCVKVEGDYYATK